MGAVIPFPKTVRPFDTIAAVLTRADLAWADRQSQMANVAHEMIILPTAAIQARVDKIVATEGDGPLRETMAALNVTAREFEQAALAIDAARNRLAALMAATPPWASAVLTIEQ